MNEKSRIVSMQLPGEHDKKVKGSRSDNTPDDIKLRSKHTPDNPISTISDTQELRSVDNSSTSQQMTSVAGHPKNRLYINNGKSLHIIFNKELLGKLNNTKVPIKIQARGKPFHIKIGSIHQALRYLPLPVSVYHYNETAITNLLLFAKFTDEYYLICNTRIDDAIHLQSKDDGKYL